MPTQPLPLGAIPLHTASTPLRLSYLLAVPLTATICNLSTPSGASHCVTSHLRKRQGTGHVVPEALFQAEEDNDSAYNSEWSSGRCCATEGLSTVVSVSTIPGKEEVVLVIDVQPGAEAFEVELALA